MITTSECNFSIIVVLALLCSLAVVLLVEKNDLHQKHAVGYFWTFIDVFISYLGIVFDWNALLI